MRATGRIANGAGHEVRLIPVNSHVYPDVVHSTQADDEGNYSIEVDERLRTLAQDGSE